MSRALDQSVVDAATQTETRLARGFQFFCDQIPGITWNYTDSPDQFIYAGDLYLPAVISLKEKKEGGDGSATIAEFKIEMERLEPFVSLVGRGMPFVWNVSVYDIYLDPTSGPQADFLADGQLTMIERDAAGIDLAFRPLSAWLEKSVPMMVYSTTDVRVPYSPDFGVDPDAVAVAASVSQVIQNVIYSTAASGQARDYFAGGMLAYQRTIAGQVVTLRWLIINSVPSSDATKPELGYFVIAGSPILLSSEDSAFSVYPGYDGSVDQSVNRFNNFTAGTGYFGFPWLPPQNPVLTSQSASKAPATSDQTPTVDHYENSQGYIITQAAMGQQVAILSPADFSDFGRPASNDSLVVNGITVDPLSWSTSRIVFVVPNTSTSPLTITLNTSTGLTTSDDNLALSASPSIDHVVDATGASVTSAAVTQKITVIGVGFGPSLPGCFVSIGALQIDASSGRDFRWTDTAITLDLPAAASYPFTGQLQVHSSVATIDGSDFTISGTSASNLITAYLNASGIAITSAPALTTIRIAGAGFGKTKGAIVFNGLEVSAGGGAYKSWSDTAVIVTVPIPDSFPFTGTVILTTAAGLVTTGEDFTIGCAAGLPWIDSYRSNIPGTGPGPIVTTGIVASKTYYFIIGENFGSGRGVLGEIGFATSPVTYPSDVSLDIHGHPTGSVNYIQWTARSIKILLWALPVPTSPVPVVVTRGDGESATGPNFDVST